MITVMLSHFDVTIGPRIFLTYPETETEVNKDFNKIPHLLDLQNSGFFVHSPRYRIAALIKTGLTISTIGQRIKSTRLNI